MAGLLGDVGNLLAGIRTQDAGAACRAYHVVLIADGGDTCGGNAWISAGGLRAAGFPVHVVGFATGSDDGGQAELGEIARAGGTGYASFSANRYELSSDLDFILDEIRAESVVVELCNSVDDDCDGLVDEGFPVGDPCDNGSLGVCHRSGVRACSAGGNGTECVLAGEPVLPAVETCNGLDDDCDGFVDEQGVCGVAESCNGADDDDDGAVDEDFPVGQMCDDGALDAFAGREGRLARSLLG